MKNAIEFNNNIKLDVVISKAFSFSRFFATPNGNLKDYIPEIKTIVSELDPLSLETKKNLYSELISKNNDYMRENDRSNKDRDQSRSRDTNHKVKDKNSISKSKENVLDFQLPDLDDAEQGNVITRFPPEPNGYPHIGHAKAAIIDEEYSKKYNGKLILRYDDTNPLKEKIEYYDAIKAGLDWLGVKPQIIKNTSDDIEKLYEYARKLIQKNFAYVCTCAPRSDKEKSHQLHHMQLCLKSNRKEPQTI